MFCSAFEIYFVLFSDFCDVTYCPTESTCVNMAGNDTTCRCDNGFFRLNGRCAVPRLAYKVRSILWLVSY